MAHKAVDAGFGSHARTDWVLCTGQPGSGKTTAVKTLADGLARSHRLRGFVTEEVLGAGGSRVGFDVVTVPDGQRGVLSRKGGPAGQPKTGQYSVDVEAFEALALPTLADDDDPSVVYILDEIGRMELHSHAFASRVQELLARGVRLLGAITAPIYGHRVAFCDRVCASGGVVVHRLTAKVRDEVVLQLSQELADRWHALRPGDSASPSARPRKRAGPAPEDAPGSARERPRREPGAQTTMARGKTAGGKKASARDRSSLGAGGANGNGGS